MKRGLVSQIAHSTVSLILRNADLQPHRSRYWITPTLNPDFLQQAGRILWLYTPSNPKTGVPSKWLFLWTIPLIVFANVVNLGWLNQLWVKAFPFLASRPYAVIQNLAEPAVGQWWLLGVLAVDIAFNYLVGEELIFRGILLPRMNGVFGKWDVLANHLLFSAYHLHFLWTTPARLLINWIFPWSAKHFKSYWVAAIIHGSDAVFLLYIFPMAIMGLVGG